MLQEVTMFCIVNLMRATLCRSGIMVSSDVHRTPCFGYLTMHDVTVINSTTGNRRRGLTNAVPHIAT